MSAPHWRAKVLTAVLASIAMLGMVLACTQLLATLVYEHPRFRSPFVGSATAAAFDATNWRRAYASLLLARRLQPWDPVYRSELGNLRAWQALWHPPGTAAGIEHHRRAADYYREAMALRPAWPVGWSLLAEAQLGESGAGPVFEALLKRANSLGPWERDVHWRTALLGMALWDSLSVAAQAQVGGTIGRLVKAEGNVESLVRMADRFGSAHLLPADSRRVAK